MKRQKGGIPLNCVDRGMFALHTKNEFMILHVVLTVSGTVEPVRLRSALMAAVEHHPVLIATICCGLLGQARLIQDISRHDPLTVSDLTGTQARSARNLDRTDTLCRERLSQWMNRPLDPTRDLPWRALLLRKRDAESSLVFTFHHSATDGLGALRFIDDVIRRYNGVTQEPAPPVNQPGHEGPDELVALARASRPGMSHFYLRMMTSLCHRFAIAPFSPNARISRRCSRSSPATCFCRGTLNPHELRQIRSTAKTAGATLNDALLAAGFRTIDRWNSVHGKHSGKISIMVPVDVGRATSTATRGNRVSFISVSTVRRERTDLQELLGRVHQKTSNMLRNGTAFSIVYAVYLCCRFSPQVAKAVARFLLATRVYLDSILVTNLGAIQPGGSASMEARKMGDATITSVVVLPPVVSPMGMSVSAATYNDHLHVALAYKTLHFSHTEARLFLNLLLHELRSYQRTAEGVLVPSVTERTTRETAPATQS